MSDDVIKVKVTADGATQAAAQVDKLTASLLKANKTQEMLAKTSEQIKRENYTNELKKQAAAVNGLAEAFDRERQAAGAAGASLGRFGSDTQELRRHLSPAAALVGNLSGSLSVLVPEAGGATKALQMAGLAGSQMLGVLGGGPGIIIGGLIAAVGGLASYFASAKKEADDLAKATEANAKAMGSYLDQLTKLRGEVSAARQQKESESDLQNRLSTNRGSVAENTDELATLRARLKNPYYTQARKRSIEKGQAEGLEGGQLWEAASADMQKRKDEARAIIDRISEIKAGLKEARSQADALKDEESKKKSAALDFDVAGTPVAGKSKDRGDMNVPDSIRKVDEMIIASQEKVKDYERQQALLGFDDWKTQQEQKAALEQKARDDKFMLDGIARKQDQAADAQHMKELADNRKLFQDLAIQSSQIIAGSAIKSFQMIAKGQKAEVGAILEGIGDQIVAMGTGYIFKGIAESIMLSPQGPALIGVGTAAVGFGIGLGAVGARQPGGSTAGGTGSAGANANPFGANPYSNPQSPVNANAGPTIININMPTVLSPSAEDGLRIQQALDAKKRAYGS